MPQWITGLLSNTVLAVLSSAISGGFLLWLEFNGVDLKRLVADALHIAQSPENLLATLVLLSILLGLVLTTLLYAAWRFIIGLGRPPVPTTKALRSALISVREHALDIVPQEAEANAALARLRAVAFELQPYTKFAGPLEKIQGLVETYLTRISPGFQSHGSAEEIASLHDQAIEAVTSLMAKTSWAVQQDVRPDC